MKVADRLGRRDWWNVKAEYTPFEWQLEISRALVEPWGEERADLRFANAFYRFIASQSTEEPGEELFDRLRYYLEVNQPPEQVLTPQQMQAATS